MTVPNLLGTGGVAAVFVLAVVAGGAAPASASVLSIFPDRDNTLYEDAAGSISNGSGQYLFAGLTLEELSRRALLRFNVASQVPAGATITSASITLHMSRGTSSFSAMPMHRVSAAWGEGASDADREEGAGIGAEAGDATWLNTFYPGSTWATPGGDFDPTPSAIASVGGVGFWTWGSTPQLVGDVQAMLDQPALNFGWIVLGDEFDTPPTAKRFDSRENPEVSFRPVLNVEYVVVPGTSTGAGVLVFGVLAMRRRR